MATANAAVCAHVLSVLVLVLVAVPHVVLAADPPKNDAATAHALFYEGRTLMQQSRYADAYPKLEESMRLRPGLGTEFNLADCNEHLGKVTSAWAGFLAVAAAAKAANQPEREKVARKRAQALDARLPKLVIEVTPSPAFVEVRRDGIDIGAAAWGMPVPVDPGTHRISATATGKGTWETTITAIEGKTVRVSVPRELPPAPSVAVAPARVGGSPPVQSEAFTTTTTTAATDFPAPIIEQNGDAQRTVGWIVGSAGVVGLGLGAGFALSSLGKRNDSRSHCVGNQCDAAGVGLRDAAGVGLRDDAIRDGNVATVATIVAGAAVAGGVVLMLTAPRNPESQGRAGAIRAVPNVAVNGGGVLVQGSFQ